MGSSPVKSLVVTSQYRHHATQAQWLMKFPPSVTYLEFEVLGELVGDGSKINFPHLQHLNLRYESTKALPLFAKMPSIHTITMDPDAGQTLPLSCTRLNSRFDRSLVFPPVKHLHLYGSIVDLERGIDLSHAENITISLDQGWPTIGFLEWMVSKNAKFTDGSLLNRALESYRNDAQMNQDDLDAMKAEFPWYV
eukprot:TRINITY_DN3056_c0_g1_i2.p1 TRINITY_DN3056_c0_g1~~TRINITY_DN3056_c0_g1_i2.p1  ORF type:complete len:194 (-),score=37.04 TRINITY_DN3056_c0_g1_i2:27-608(-)